MRLNPPLNPPNRWNCRRTQPKASILPSRSAGTTRSLAGKPSTWRWFVPSDRPFPGGRPSITELEPLISRKGPAKVGNELGQRSNDVYSRIPSSLSSGYMYIYFSGLLVSGNVTGVLLKMSRSRRGYINFRLCRYLQACQLLSEGDKTVHPCKGSMHCGR